MTFRAYLSSTSQYPGKLGIVQYITYFYRGFTFRVPVSSSRGEVVGDPSYLRRSQPRRAREQQPVLHTGYRQSTEALFTQCVLIILC